MNYLAILPPLLMVLFASVTLLMDVAAPAKVNRSFLVWFNAAGSALVGCSLVRQWRLLGNHPGSAIVTWQGAVTIDGLSLFTDGLVWLAAAGLLLISYRYLELVQEHRGEYYALALFAQCGMYFMAGSVDLIALFVGLEIAAISFYILVGFTRADRRSNEAALKYLLLGGLSSGFVLYGFSLLYGVTGSTSLAEIGAVVSKRSPDDPYILIAVVTILVGLLFKVSAAPFHSWAPDAYDGSPTPVTGYLAVASKIASFAVLIRFLTGPLAANASIWRPIVVVVAVVSLTIGSVAAITQDRLKRLFAYSGIAHAGYVLLGFVAGTPGGYQGVYMYLLVYAVMNLGAFAVLTSLRSHGIAGDHVADLRGLSQTHPVHAALFSILLLSLAGIPPTAGFIGKYFIFAALIKTGHVTLAVIASVYVVISLYFYFRLVREMYLESADGRRALAASLGVRVALVATSALTLAIGLFPQPALNGALRLLGRAQ